MQPFLILVKSTNRLIPLRSHTLLCIFDRPHPLDRSLLVSQQLPYKSSLVLRHEIITTTKAIEQRKDTKTHVKKELRSWWVASGRVAALPRYLDRQTKLFAFC